MYLKRLEISGFKSFADKTKLDFEPGITAIVGPNGCGKSNVADSIRWCLGEQSVRSLRSRQMLDVIFNGSQSRPATGMSEVSLTFDNSQNMLPIDYSEVTITRRLFRSGESEYFINKVQCRLKDIRDMFLDTGIGSEGYSIMEQGKVEYVLSSKPEDRRQLFEEAAGVSKYKARKEETLRKLEKVETDMNRINDMLSMLKEQISQLDSQARKARQFQKYRDDLKRLELAALVKQAADAETGIARIAVVLEPKQMEFERQNTQLAQVEAEISELRMQQMEKDQRYVALQEELSQIKSDINLCDERSRSAGEREQEFAERKEQLISELGDNGVRLTQAQSEQANLVTMRQQLTEQVAALEADYRLKEGKAEEIRTELLRLQTEENTCRQFLFTSAESKTNIHNETNRLSSLKARCEGQILSLQKELSRLEAQRSPLLDEIARMQTESDVLSSNLETTASNRQTAQQSIIELQTKVADNLEQQSSLKAAIVANESKLQALREWEQKDPQRAAIISLTEAHIAGIQGPLSNFVSITPEHHDVVLSLLGDTLNYVVCESREAALAAVAYLETNHLARLTFIIPSLLPAPTAGAAASGPAALASVTCSEPVRRALQYLVGDPVINDQTVIGDAFVQGGTITFDKPLLVEKQLRGYTEAIEVARSGLTQSTEEGTLLAQQLAQTREALNNHIIEQQNLRNQSEWLAKQLAAKHEELQFVEKELALNNDDITARTNEEKSIDEQQTALRAQLASIEAEEQKTMERQAQLEQEFQLWRTEENTAAPLLTEAKVAWATQVNELNSRQREEERLRETIAGLQQQTEQARAELTSLETRLIDQKTIQETEAAKLRHLYVQQEEKDTEVQASLTERQQVQYTIEAHNSQIHELRTQVETFKTDIHNLQMEQRSFELQRFAVDKRLSDDFSTNYPDSKAEYGSVEVDEEEIVRLKRKLESMGSVNLAAPEEYTNIEERYNFLLTQQQDLLKARDDLKQVIAKINQTTLESFKKTFDQVRENFINIYKQLFEGGQADLLLTDEANLLETGVDILAQPPGKRLQNIALLSGGEKALTAIALLFAFFMVRTSPFCILDEVDAPLDEANVGRFTGMVKSFADKTQFILITHSKRSMETADVLYGVTMEELGVSKIISVRMNKEAAMSSADAGLNK